MGGVIIIIIIIIIIITDMNLTQLCFENSPFLMNSPNYILKLSPL